MINLVEKEMSGNWTSVLTRGTAEHTVRNGQAKRRRHIIVLYPRLVTCILVWAYTNENRPLIQIAKQNRKKLILAKNSKNSKQHQRFKAVVASVPWRHKPNEISTVFASF